MKIKAEPKEKYNAVICLEENCPWTRVCANHTSAGDFRSEGGPRPKLKLLNGELHCETFHSKGDGCEYHELPTLVDTRVWVPYEWQMFSWSQLVEETNNYQI